MKQEVESSQMQGPTSLMTVMGIKRFDDGDGDQKV